MFDDGCFTLNCPIPLSDYPKVLLAHGGGGRLMRGLIDNMFAPAFANPFLNQMGDSAVMNFGQRELAFTTDSYVVHPLFFPGGDIGTLAVNGTVNDLAMSGARPLYLSVGFILEEGLSMETLWQIVQSMRGAADKAQIQLVTGDTKVVDRGRGDGLYVNTAGIGIIEHKLKLAPGKTVPGDIILLNGNLGRHGIAVMAAREGLSFETTIESDCAPLADLTMRLLAEEIEIHCMRDLTRGGLGSALVEIAESGRVDIHVDERAIPVEEEVLGACEILGLDPLYIANEGRFICFVAAPDADRALEIMRSHPLGKEAVVIGEVGDGKSGVVSMTSSIGATRIVDMLSGDQLPRIC